MWCSRTFWWSATPPASPPPIGVREYLVVDPLEHYSIRFLLDAEGFDKGAVFAADERLVIATLESLEVPLWEVFELAGPEEVAVDER